MSKYNRIKLDKVSIFCLGLIAVLCLIILMVQPYKQVSVRFQHADTQIRANLVLPKKRGDKVPVMIFVHGDGAASSSSAGYYRAIWKALADAGVASFSWDKLGVGGSEGSWLAQSMEDRAKLLTSAIDYLAKRADIDANKIGLIGFSQAGWVVPKVLAKDDRVKHAILVSTAVNWLEQSVYQTSLRLSEEGQTGDQVARNLKYKSETDDLIAKGASYEAYLQFRDNNVPKSYLGHAMKEQRYHFVQKNIKANAQADLAAVRQPIRAFFGDSDRYVDIKDSIRQYSEIIGSQFSYRVFDQASHTLLKESRFEQVQPGSLWFVVKLNWLGPEAFADEFIQEIVDWVEHHV